MYFKANPNNVGVVQLNPSVQWTKALTGPKIGGF